MRFLAAFTILLMMALAMPAFACSPPAADGRPSAQDVAQEMLKPSEGRFIGKVEVTAFDALETGGMGDYKITYKVLKQYVGAPMEQITVIARSNTCQFYKPHIGQTDLINVDVSGEGNDLPQLSEGFPLVSDEDLEAALDELTAGKQDDQ